MPATSRRRRLARTVAASLAVGALAAPAASARPAYDAPASAPTAAQAAQAPPVVRTVDDGGFDWGAAGLGAGAAAGIALLGLGGTAARQRSHHRMHPAG